MWIRVEGGGSDNVDKDFCMFQAFVRAVLTFLMHIYIFLLFLSVTFSASSSGLEKLSTCRKEFGGSSLEQSLLARPPSTIGTDNCTGIYSGWRMWSTCRMWGTCTRKQFLYFWKCFLDNRECGPAAGSYFCGAMECQVNRDSFCLVSGNIIRNRC